MERKLCLIDHTFESIRKLYGCNTKDCNILPILEKYGVDTIDLSINSAADMKKDDSSVKIRVETDISREKTERLKRLNKQSFNGIVIRWRHKKKTSVPENFINDLKTISDELFIKIVNAPEVKAEEWIGYADLMKRHHLKGILYCDEEGTLDPFVTYENLKYLKEIIPEEIEFCAGNVLGLAGANSLAAVNLGIYRIHTIVGGANLSEAAAMEEILMACKYFKLTVINPPTEKLAKDCRKIMRYLNLKVPVDKAIIGSRIFAHESGIHVDGVIKNPQLYEVIRPEEVGIKRKIVIGKYSGKAAVRFQYHQMGIELTEEELLHLMKIIKQTARKKNAALSYKQLNNLYMAEFGKQKPMYGNTSEKLGGIL